MTAPVPTPAPTIAEQVAHETVRHELHLLHGDLVVRQQLLREEIDAIDLARDSVDRALKNTAAFHRLETPYWLLLFGVIIGFTLCLIFERIA